MVRTDATAEASLAAILARSRLGMAMAAMMRIMATTINSSIREKPLSFEFLTHMGELHSRICLQPRRGEKTKPDGSSFLGHTTLSQHIGYGTSVTAHRAELVLHHSLLNSRL